MLTAHLFTDTQGRIILFLHQPVYSKPSPFLNLSSSDCGHTKHQAHVRKGLPFCFTGGTKGPGRGGSFPTKGTTPWSSTTQRKERRSHNKNIRKARRTQCCISLPATQAHLTCCHKPFTKETFISEKWCPCKLPLKHCS